MFLRRKMKFFNYEAIYMASHGNPDRIVEYFILNQSKGNNFLVNPRELANSFWVSNRHKAEYLGFASFRNYDSYLSTGLVDLPIIYLPPWVPISLAKENPLLTVTDKYIKFDKEK